MGNEAGSRDRPGPATAKAWLRLPLAVVLGLVVFVAAGTLAQLAGPHLPGSASLREWLSTVVFQLFMGLVATVIMLLTGRGRLGGFGFRRPSHLPLGRILLVVAVAEVVVTLVLLPFQRAGPAHFAAEYSWWQIVIGVLLVASTMEEVLSRGLVQGVAEPLRAVGLRLGETRLSLPVITAAFFFSLMHVPLLLMGIDTVTGVQILLSTLVLGLIAGFYREGTGSLVPAVIAHVWANVCGIGIDGLLGLLS